MQKIWNKYRKIILGVLAAVFFTLLVFFSYNKLKFLFKKKDNVSDLETVADVQQTVLKFHPLTFTAAWYSDTAEQLWSVMKDYIYITKCPWDKISFAFTKMMHYGDFLELKKAFGLRSYGVGVFASNYSLPNYIQVACSKECQVFYGAYVTGWEKKFKSYLMDAKRLFWATPLNNAGVSEYESRTPYLILAAIDEAGVIVYGAENIVDAPDNKMIDEFLVGTINARLSTLDNIQLESNLTRSSKTVLNGIYNEILICEVPDYSVLKPKQ